MSVVYKVEHYSKLWEDNADLLNSLDEVTLRNSTALIQIEIFEGLQQCSFLRDTGS
jgi:hypothetical protein